MRGVCISKSDHQALENGGLIRFPSGEWARRKQARNAGGWRHILVGKLHKSGNPSSIPRTSGKVTGEKRCHKVVL